MDKLAAFRNHGLFDARAPRYTSYPPANRFEAGTGQRWQSQWIEAVPEGQALSVYVHIPFCRRLCWFCACRTQGTTTRAPVDGYLDDLIAEIQTVSSRLTGRPKMARLHLGGGTPTLLTPGQMNRLMQALHGGFDPTDDYEFSVEIDPTEADPRLIDELAAWKLGRASIGVQDFRPEIQAAIGREQSVAETCTVVDQLRRLGVESLNIDLLYGLPHQTGDSLIETLTTVADLKPDRLALYGYAHVPHASKRQVLIDADALPRGEDRYHLTATATDFLNASGYEALGIDHFARPSDSLARAAKNGAMRRNFQGYTDDPCGVLLGFGASAISQYPQGYSQNAVATGAYRARVAQTGLAPHRGYVLTETDKLIARIIEMLMCQFRIDWTELARSFPDHTELLNALATQLQMRFSDVMVAEEGTLRIAPGLELLARVIAGALDVEKPKDFQYSKAV